MKRVFLALTGFLLTLVLLMVSCAAKEQPTTSTTTQATSKAATTAPLTQGNESGKPQYGGLIISRLSAVTPQFDVSDWQPTEQTELVFEPLFGADWALDRQTWDFQEIDNPLEFTTGRLVESWEMANPQNMTLHIREGIRFASKPPVNGRELTANDIEFHYDRVLGTGNGFTKPNPYYVGYTSYLEKVTATDSHTVNVKFKIASYMAVLQLTSSGTWNRIESPEAVKQYGDNLKTDWKLAVGTGPFLLTDYVSGSSLTYTRNPNYWGHDERNPENQVPYVNLYKLLIIPDSATAMSALRAGKIDMMGVSWQNAESLLKTNPELQKKQLAVATNGLTMRVDKAPFTDIRVRQALQMSIDRQTIAKNYYGGYVDGKPCGLMRDGVPGWTLTYDQWPQELKDVYSYNPTRAKQLLAAAGLATGFKTNVVTASNADLDLLQIVKSYFMDIGVDMEIKTMDPAGFMPFLRAGLHDQMYYFFECGHGFSPQISALWRSSKSGVNFSYNKDPRMDVLGDAVFAATDEAQAKKAFNEVSMYTREQNLAVIVCPSSSFTLWEPYLKGYSGEAYCTMSWAVPRIWIDQNLKKSLGR